jgi:2-furoyl-CoA dehydrogenase large subunit
VDAVGTVSVTADLTVQGQGHATALSQIVADELGLNPAEISINLELDTQKDAWSIAAGTYSCRFSPGTAVAAQIAARQIREKVARIAAKQLNTVADDIDFGDGRVFSKGNPDNSAPFARIAGTAHWSPVLMPESDKPGLSETGIWSPPELEPPTSKDEINTSLTYGFVFDMCGVEIDPVTMHVRVDRYISMHDAGKLINPLLAEGQIHGAFVQGLASALYEEIVYDETGALKSGTFAEYLVPTACEVPPIELLHIETPSPFTPLGAKGLAEGNCMSTPVCIANAVADALSIKDVPLPITPDRLNTIIGGQEPDPPEGAPAERAADGVPSGGAAIMGTGSVTVSAPADKIWDALLDPQSLKQIIPGCHTVAAVTPEHYRAEVSLGVGPIRGRFTANVRLHNLDPKRAADLAGDLVGPLGRAKGQGHVALTSDSNGTRIDYSYGVDVGGKVASVGGRMIKRAAQIVIGQFFEKLASVAAGSRPTDAVSSNPASQAGMSVIAKLLGWVARTLRGGR